MPSERKGDYEVGYGKPHGTPPFRDDRRGDRPQSMKQSETLMRVSTAGPNRQVQWCVWIDRVDHLAYGPLVDFSEQAQPVLIGGSGPAMARRPAALCLVKNVLVCRVEHFLCLCEMAPAAGHWHPAAGIP
jgi:hypothetical protein